MTKIYTAVSMKIRNAYHELGFLGLFKEFYYISTDVFFDLKFNIKTQNFLDKTDYDAPDPESIEYVGTRYVQLFNVFNKLPIDYANSTLLDIGCGKARVIAVASTHPFKKIIGVEYDENLALLGQKNVSKIRCKTNDHIEVHHQNAITYDIPDDVNVIYMFNPFVGTTLEKVVDNIRCSYERNPRKIHILFLNYDDFDLIIKDQTWLAKISTMPTVDTVNASLYATH